MNPKIIFWLVFAALTAMVIFLNVKYGMLLDESTRETKKPYSYARAQLTWWTVIVLSGFATIILKRQEIPTLTNGILILLGISSATTMAARLSDNSDQDQTEIKVSFRICQARISCSTFFQTVMGLAYTVCRRYFSTLSSGFGLSMKP